MATEHNVSDMLLEATICRLSSLASMSEMEQPPPIVKAWLEEEKGDLFGDLIPLFNAKLTLC